MRKLRLIGVVSLLIGVMALAGMKESGHRVERR